MCRSFRTFLFLWCFTNKERNTNCSHARVWEGIKEQINEAETCEECGKRGKRNRPNLKVNFSIRFKINRL